MHSIFQRGAGPGRGQSFGVPQLSLFVVDAAFARTAMLLPTTVWQTSSMWPLGSILLALAFSTAAAAPKAASPVQREASIFGLVMEDATFADAESVLGPAEVRHNGGAAAASAHPSCYVGSDGTALVLSRINEQSRAAITSFQLLTSFALAEFSENVDLKPRPEAIAKCARSSTLSRAVATGGGLTLGMTPVEVERVLAHKLECGSHSKCSIRLEDKERTVRDRGSNIVGHPSAWITIGREQGQVAAIRIV